MRRLWIACIAIMAVSGAFPQVVRANEAPFTCSGYHPSRSTLGRAKRVGTSSPFRQTALVIFAKFRGKAPEDSLAPPYAHDLFDPNLPGSLSHFYDAMSFGQLQLTGSVLPKRYSSDHPASFYVSSSDTVVGEYGLFVQEILRKADAEVDFGEYDNDGSDGVPNSGDDDGYVDLLFLNLRSTPSRFLIGPATGIAALGLKVDWVSDDLSPDGERINVRADKHPEGPGGCMQRVWGFHHAVGCMAHEYGHILGLPDLYDTSFLWKPDQDPDEDSAGIGRWGLMGWGASGWHGDDGPVPFCGWSREQLGWSRVERIEEDTEDLALEDVETGGTIYRIQIGTEERYRPVGEIETSDMAVGGEYFLLEYRSREGGYYDRNMPGDGVLIWHVGAGSTNEVEMRKLVDLECADGLYDEERNADPVGGKDDLDEWAHDEAYTAVHGGNLGDAGDLFDGEAYTAFTLRTNPSSENAKLEYGEASTGVSITDIRREGERMAMDVELPRWSGSITQDVCWFGEVDVMGDVVVEERGSLTLDPHTVVRFASGDATRGGMDPDRCELMVKGQLDLRGTARFVGTEGADWLGIGLSTRSRVRDMLRLLAVEMEDAERGIFYTEPWSGTYARLEPLVWFDTVEVTGDVILDAPLVVLPGTVVRVARTDDQRSGADPERCELSLKRTFSIHGTPEEPIRLTSLSERPSDADWYGIRLSETAPVRAVEIGNTGFGYGINHHIIEHAQHGIFWDGHLGESRLVFEPEPRYRRIWDSSYWEWIPVGNGDGQVNPGENPHVRVGSVRNLSVQDVDSLFMTVSTDDPFVRFCPVYRRVCTPPNIGKWLLDLGFGFTLASDTPAGHTIVFRVDFVVPGIGGGQDTVVVKVAEGLDNTPPCTEIDAWPTRVEVGSPIHLRAIAADGGRIARVTARIYRGIYTNAGTKVDQLELRPVQEEHDCLTQRLPWLRFDVFLEADVFEGEWVVPSEGNFYVRVDAEDRYGNRNMSGKITGFSSTPFIPSSEMVLVGHILYNDTGMMRILNHTGVPYDLWNTLYRGPMDSVAMARYRGDLIVWCEDRTREQDRGLIAHLAEGGRLLVFPSYPPLAFSSYPLPREEDLTTHLGIRTVEMHERMKIGIGIPGDPITDGMTFHGGAHYCQYSAVCHALSSLQPETVPILTDVDGRVVGMRVEKDGYKAVYFIVELEDLGSEGEIRELIDRAVQWLHVPCTSVSVEEEIEPSGFALHPNHPNPFNATTVVSYDVPELGHVRLVVYDLLGQAVRVLVNRPVPAGHHTVRWNGQDEERCALASGVYLCRMEAGNYSAVRKTLLLR